MQLTSLAPTDLGLARTAAGGAAAPTRTAALGNAAQATTAPADAPLPTPRAGLRTWAPERNAEVANAQRALGFLDQLGGQLQDAKDQLSRRLAGGFVADGTLDDRRQRLDRLWQDRAAQTGGSLDAQLGFQADGQAAQRFRVRGLDRHALQAAGGETLVFALGNAPRERMAVRVDPALSPTAQARRFDQALAPAGIRAEIDARGELGFSVPQAQWPQVRDALVLKGDGKRFPTGQFSRVRSEPAAPALDPAGWDVSSPEGVRRALPQVVQAAQQVAKARTDVQRTLDVADRLLDAARPAAGADAAQALADDFARRTDQAGYATLAALTPSLRGLPRYRVDRLLA